MTISNKTEERMHGFTLIETLVAIVVIGIGFVGALTLITSTISFMSLGSSRLIASYLAQEGVEIVRNIRDSNWLEVPEPTWDQGLNYANEDFLADFNDSALISDNGTTHLKIDSNGFYNYDSGTETIFTRKITIDRDSNCDELLNGGCIKVAVVVNWQQKGKDYSVSAKEYLYNWNNN